MRMTPSQKAKKIAQVLLKRFPSLSMLEALEIAVKILDAIDD